MKGGKLILPDGTSPGIFRWDVKTLQDPAAGQVAFDKILTVTPAEISTWHYPGVTSGSPRGRGKEEFQVFSVAGKAIKTKLEADGDYHLLIEDASLYELGVEIVQPLFAPNSIKLPNLKTVRATFEGLFTKSNSVDAGYRRLDGREITVTGVGFWDEPHGQGGIGNGFELHPVLSIK